MPFGEHIHAYLRIPVIDIHPQRVDPSDSLMRCVSSSIISRVMSSIANWIYISLIIVSRISESCTIEVILNSSSLSL